ncbi:hypothetical protein [Paracoccus sp. SY]|uniref:hypothetical protein n=1 Tax=Paracoccus sp. SY TaxID=1330255 RepID=UPI001304FB4C|nr:hypothetical protein [Paracoccus sp. SY]
MSAPATSRDCGPCPLLGDLLSPGLPLPDLRQRAADEIIYLRRQIAALHHERDAA